MPPALTGWPKLGWEEPDGRLGSLPFITLSNLASLIMGVSGEIEHIAFQLPNRSGLLFAPQILLENARIAKHVRPVIHYQVAAYDPHRQC